MSTFSAIFNITRLFLQHQDDKEKEKIEKDIEKYLKRAVRNGDFKGVLDSLDEIDKELGKENALVSYLRAYTYHQSAEHVKAEYFIEDALSKNPRKAEYYSLKAEILNGLGKIDLALDTINMALENNGQNIEFLILKCSYLGKLERWDEAEEIVNLVLSLEPGNFEILLYQAIILLYVKNNNEAGISLLEKIEDDSHDDLLILRALNIGIQFGEDCRIDMNTDEIKAIVNSRQQLSEKIANTYYWECGYCKEEAGYTDSDLEDNFIKCKNCGNRIVIDQ